LIFSTYSLLTGPLPLGTLYCADRWNTVRCLATFEAAQIN
jgi:hypothetical protein